MKKVYLIMAVLLCVALVSVITIAQNPGVDKWQDTYGVRYWFQVGGGSATGTAAFIAKRDSSRFSKPVQFNSTVKTVGTTLAKIDSFSGTLTSDTTVMSGATAGDVFSITRYNPAWSATSDTGAWTYDVSVLNTDSVLITRRARLGSALLKSGAQYMLVKIDK